MSLDPVKVPVYEFLPYDSLPPWFNIYGLRHCPERAGYLRLIGWTYNLYPELEEMKEFPILPSESLLKD